MERDRQLAEQDPDSRNQDREIRDPDAPAPGDDIVDEDDEFDDADDDEDAEDAEGEDEP